MMLLFLFISDGIFFKGSNDLKFQFHFHFFKGFCVFKEKSIFKVLSESGITALPDYPRTKYYVKEIKKIFRATNGK